MNALSHTNKFPLLAATMSFAFLANASAQTADKAAPNPEKSAAVTPSQTPSDSNKTASSKKPDTSAKPLLPSGHPPVSYLLVPLKTPEQDQWMKKGCWAKFYDKEGYEGDMLTLLGPMEMNNMIGPFGIDWEDKISSLQTGPNTTVFVYDNEGLRQLVATFKPDQKVPLVNRTMGFFEEFESLKITCDTAQSTRTNQTKAK